MTKVVTTSLLLPAVRTLIYTQKHCSVSIFPSFHTFVLHRLQKCGHRLTESGVNKYHWQELPQVSFLSRQTCVLSWQNYACLDETFVVTYICHNNFCRDKYNFVVTKVVTTSLLLPAVRTLIYTEKHCSVSIFPKGGGGEGGSFFLRKSGVSTVFIRFRDSEHHAWLQPQVCRSQGIITRPFLSSFSFFTIHTFVLIIIIYEKFFYCTDGRA